MTRAAESSVDVAREDCLATGWQTISGEYDSSDVVGILVLCFLLAVAVSPLVLNLYQRSVLKLMRSRGGGEKDEPAQTETQESLSPDRPGQHRSVAAANIIEGITHRMTKAHGAMASAAITFAICAGLVIAVSTIYYEQAELESLAQWLQALVYGLVVAGCATAPVVLLDSPGRYRRGLLLIPFFVLLAVFVFDVGSDQSMTVSERISDAILGSIGIGIIYISLTGRRLRNVVPLLTLFFSVFLSSMYLIGVLLELFETCDAIISQELLLSILLLLSWPLVWLGLKLLDGMARAYEQQLFSDSQFQIGLWFLIIVILLATETTPDDDDVMFSAWSLGIVLSAAATIVVYRSKLSTQSCWTLPQPMLLLRVFSSQRNTQDFLDELNYRWSFIGPIHLVGGPDLAKAYLEPHELMLFLRRRMADTFVHSKEQLIERIKSLDNQPGPEGRFRINEFFCHDNTWRFTVRHLVRVTPAILLDLRGFDGSRAGTTFEVTLLAQMGALEKTMFLYDKSTDMHSVEAALDDVPGAKISAERIINLDQHPDPDSVLKLLAGC